MKRDTRPSLAGRALFGGPLPAGVARIARFRAKEILSRGAQHCRLVDMLAAAYLLGVEDAGDAIEHEAIR